MKNKAHSLFWVLALTLAPLFSSSAQEQKVFIAYTSRSYTALPAYIAVVKGFFREEGLDSVMVQMRAQAAIPALTNGNIDYTLGFAYSLSAIIQGAPFKITAFMAEKPLHYVVSRPEIKTIFDLRGKRLLVSRYLGLDHLAAEAVLKARGVDPKDVHFVVLGGDEPVRVEVLKKRLADAISVSPPGSVYLQKEGYQILGGPGDLKLGMPTSSIATTERRLSEKPQEVKKAIRAIVRGLRYLQERREETIAVMMQWFGQSREVATASYDMIRPSFSRDGIVTDPALQFAIEVTKKALGSSKPIHISQVRDFTILREVQNELGMR